MIGAAIARDDLTDLLRADAEAVADVLRELDGPLTSAVANDGTPIEILNGPLLADAAAVIGRLQVLQRWLGPIKLGRRIRVYLSDEDIWRRVLFRSPRPVAPGTRESLAGDVTVGEAGDP